ncbi:MAG: DUF4465 domain-containing protein [Crocinitomicaceae bacterium]
MKKLYTSAKLMGITVALSLSPSLFGQVTVDFEDRLTQVDTFWNGSDGNPSYSSNGAVFNLLYDMGFMSWDGFALSSMRDDTTSGWGNQYSSFSGGGHSSEDYAVFFPGFGGPKFIEFATDVNFAGFYINNSTYAAISMRDGDAFGKQFGSPNNADGQQDGTNGEDWFLLSIFSIDAMGNRQDSTGFYLADFRYPNSQDDYIVDQWTYVDLSSLTAGRKLEFSFSSSDVGQFGINTPTYFVMDDFSFNPVLGFEENSVEQLKIYPNPTPQSFQIFGVDYDEVRILDFAGRLVLQASGNSSDIAVTQLNKGVYFVEAYDKNILKARGKMIKE